MTTTLKSRVGELERVHGVGQRLALAVLETLVVVDGEHGDADVIGVRVGQGEAARHVERLPGESLAALEARANPKGRLVAISPDFAVGVRPYDERLREHATRPGCLIEQGESSEQ